MSGMHEYSKRWPGQVTAIVGQDRDVTHNPGLRSPEAGPVNYRFTPDVRDELKSHLTIHPHSVVLGSLNVKYRWLPETCSQGGAALVLAADNPPSVPKDLELLQSQTTVERGRILAGYMRRRKQLADLASEASGIQCNGRPAFTFYSRHNARTIQFLDSRISIADIQAARQARSSRARNPDRQVLAFSGRIIPIKGSRMLVPLVQQLRKLKTPFHLLIMGEGSDRTMLEFDLGATSSRPDVEFLGELPFKEAWVRTMRDTADLIVMPHLVGDSSSTYMEAMGCGVPIVGFDNAMLRSLQQEGLAAWSVRRGAVTELAATIDQIGRDPESTSRASSSGLAIMDEHSVESTFDRRVAHLLEIGASLR